MAVSTVSTVSTSRHDSLSSWDGLTLCDFQTASTDLHRRAELSRERSMAIVQLLGDGADVNQRDDLGRTALSWAASNRLPGIVYWLIEYGADINIIDLHGRTPLSWAAQAGSHHVVKILVEKGADVNLARGNGLRPLEAVMESGRGEEATIVMKILKKFGAKRSWRHRLRHGWFGHGYLKKV
ncbi:hypothetical protein I7I51_07344 [Histoplasma capsulatum]|uniref:Ankyrin repeat protein n=1 Tax=Ajellomyces capsulatus TaxID=5037 RepID=A0A8A1MR02_AJECA|nr:hypothetical protein I7I51_07344 [Histoplasma capsulatum]